MTMAMVTMACYFADEFKAVRHRNHRPDEPSLSYLQAFPHTWGAPYTGQVFRLAFSSRFLLIAENRIKTLLSDHNGTHHTLSEHSLTEDVKRRKNTLYVTLIV